MPNAETCNIKGVVHNIKRWYREHGSLQFSAMTRDGLFKVNRDYRNTKGVVPITTVIAYDSLYSKAV